MKKTHDLAVKTGSYATASGEKKGRYENVGMILETDNGEMMLLKRTFNPAGVPNPDGRDSVVLYRFEVKPRQQSTPQGSGGDDFDDPIPFRALDWRVC